LVQNKLDKEFKNPPRNYSIMPFWWWNRTLSESERLESGLINTSPNYSTIGIFKVKLYMS
jgi:hypothetical protein